MQSLAFLAIVSCICLFSSFKFLSQLFFFRQKKKKMKWNLHEILKSKSSSLPNNRKMEMIEKEINVKWKLKWEEKSRENKKNVKWVLRGTRRVQSGSSNEGERRTSSQKFKIFILKGKRKMYFSFRCWYHQMVKVLQFYEVMSNLIILGPGVVLKHCRIEVWLKKYVLMLQWSTPRYRSHKKRFLTENWFIRIDENKQQWR